MVNRVNSLLISSFANKKQRDNSFPPKSTLADDVSKIIIVNFIQSRFNSSAQMLPTSNLGVT